MADITNTVKVLFQGEDQTASASAKAVSTSLEKVGSDADGASKGLGNFSDKAGAASGAIQALATSLAVKAFVDVNIAFEQFTKTMTIATGSAEGAAKEFDFVRDVAQRLGVDALATAGSYAQFAAAVKGTALEGQGARTIFEGFVGAMSRVGASSADTAGAMVQLAQGVSKGKFELDDLKSIAERVPGFFNQLAQTLGISNEAMFDLVSQGKITGTEILKLAETFKTSFDPSQFEGFQNSFSRLQNTINQAFIDIGEAGAFEGLIRGIEVITATATGAAAVIRLMGEYAANIAFTLSSGDFRGFPVRFQESIDNAANSTKSLTDALTGAARESVAASTSTQDLSKSLSNAGKSSEDLKATAEAFKTLGVNAEKSKIGVKEVLGAFDQLIKAPSVNGNQLLAGLESVLKTIDDKKYLPKLKDQLQAAWEQGKITGDDLAKAFQLIYKEQEGLDKKLGITTKSIEQQAKEAEKAAEKAATFRLELEKLASNERIKALEFKAQLDITNVQEQTKRIQAAFESLDNTVNSTADVINQAFGLLAGGGDLVDSSVRNKLFSQLDIENANRDRALNLQAELTAAQIKVLTAQAEQLTRGDALIKIDGAGLAPHLEAFMWEILKAVQVRANRDGMKLLLGL